MVGQNQTYGLYQTFSAGEMPKKNITANQRKEFVKKMDSLNPDQTEAVFLLICEHARLNDDFVYDFEEIKLPYRMQKSGSDIKIDFERIPRPLKWILLKFSDIVSIPGENK